MSIKITQERPDSADSLALIEELEGVLSPLYPDESRHGYGVDKLIQEGVIFYVARQDGKAAACGGVQCYGSDYAELKRMYVRPDFRGLGMAKLLLTQISEYVLAQGIDILRLETGIHQVEAIGLYERYGFIRIAPFGDYQEDPNSVFFEKALNS